MTNQYGKDTDQLGAVAIALIASDRRPYRSTAFIAAVQEAVQRHPKLETLSFRRHRAGPGGDSLAVELTGDDIGELKRAAEALKHRLNRYRAVSALEDNLAYDKTELTLELTPRGEALGFTIDDIGQTLYTRLNGIVAATFPVGQRTGEVIVNDSSVALASARTSFMRSCASFGFSAASAISASASFVRQALRCPCGLPSADSRCFASELSRMARRPMRPSSVGSCSAPRSTDHATS